MLYSLIYQIITAQAKTPILILHVLCLEHPAGWICAHYKSIIKKLLSIIYISIFLNYASANILLSFK